MDKDSQDVVITGIKIPFFSLMGFMIKWTLASIPAVIVTAGLVIAIVMGGPILIDMLGLADILSGWLPLPPSQ